MKLKGFSRFACLFYVFFVSTASVGADPATVIEADGGYIDSHFAICPDGKSIAYLNVFTDRKADLVIGAISPKGFKEENRVNIAGHTIMPAGMTFAPDGKHVLITWVTSPADSDKDFSGAVFNLSGKLIQKIGPFRDYRFRVEGKKTTLITYSERPARGSISITVTVYGYPQIRVLAQHRLTTDQTRRLKNPNMEVLYFRDDYLKAVGRIAGRYDPEADIRLPDREAVYDLTQGKVVSETPIKEAVEWERTRRFRENHPPFEPHLYFAGAAEDMKLMLMRTDDVRVEIPLPVELARYRPESLMQRVIDRDSVLLGLTVDPQNPVILKQRRSEPEQMHLYYVNYSGKPRVKRISSLDSEDHNVQWRFGQGFLAVMRLHKRWGLGAKTIQIHRVQLP